MKKYLLLFIGKEYKPEPNSEEHKEHMKKWDGWLKDLKKKRRLEGGLPLEWSGKKINSESVKNYVLPEISIGGYLIIKANNLDEASKMCQKAPNLELGGSIIIRPCVDMKL